MMLALDTCSSLRIRNIFHKTSIDLRPILGKFRLVITKKLLLEYKNYKLDLFFPSNFIFIPLSANERKAVISKYFLESILETFDSADQDLVIIGLRDHVTLITDDRALFYQSTMLKIPTFQLWSFCLKLVKDGLLSKNDFNKCWKLWQVEKRYSKKTLKLMKSVLITL
ncbi:MAG: hypothetical protein K9W44_14830 [Candidatus Lokiarchaeota archaeon]|nr:hypothetical protein [Candidatus Harpocratesius repetitus]